MKLSDYRLFFRQSRAGPVAMVAHDGDRDRTVIRPGGLVSEDVRLWAKRRSFTDTLLIEITGEGHAFTIDGKVRVVVTKRGLECPRCGHGAYALVCCGGWGCRRCAKARYRSKYHPSPMYRRLAILRSLARVDPLSQRARELRYRLAATNRAIVERARDVERRISSSRG